MQTIGLIDLLYNALLPLDSQQRLLWIYAKDQDMPVITACRHMALLQKISQKA